MTNRLARETSPYLLQHAENPVDWYPWGPEALEAARRLDRPIFLSIGYAACHWCHVMAHESFEDPQIASILNEHFVSIKVDREERPDLDALYMEATVRLTGSGGWPMSVFLTPDGKPFYAGTYFPPIGRHGLPSFRNVLLGISQAWRDSRSDSIRRADELAEEIGRAAALVPRDITLVPEVIDRAVENLFRTYDWNHGGWGGAPKFPQPLAIELLLRRHHRSKDRLALEMATHALSNMASGGVFDQLAGGFHRYATDASWHVPHFEKMLYDNALLARAFLHAWQVTGSTALRETLEATLDFLLDSMRHPLGGFYSSLDADSDAEEGRFYTWTPAEIREALDDPALADLAISAFDVSDAGPVEGRSVLTRKAIEQDLAASMGLDAEQIQERLSLVRHRLRERRNSRSAPNCDDKVLAEWNGLMLVTLAESARALQREDLIAAARSLAQFLLAALRTPDGLRRTWRLGEARQAALLADHAALGLGLLALYETDFNPDWFRASRALAEDILRQFRDPQGGFFDTPEQHEQLIARPKSLQDGATPSGNALAVELLLRLGALTGEAKYSEPAVSALAAMQVDLARHPLAFGGWLSAFDFALGPQLQLALVGDPDAADFRQLARVAHQRFHPRLVVAGGHPGDPVNPTLLSGRAVIDGKATAYLCRSFTCDLPTTSPRDLLGQLERAG